jgi:hypothetical protein
LPALVKQIQGLVDPALLGPRGADSQFGVNTAKAVLAKLQQQTPPAPVAKVQPVAPTVQTESVGYDELQRLTNLIHYR